MTLLRLPRIKRGPVTRRPLLFSLLLLSSFNPSPSFLHHVLERHRGRREMTAAKSGIAPQSAHTSDTCRRARLVVDFAASTTVPARIMILSLLTDQRISSIVLDWLSPVIATLLPPYTNRRVPHVWSNSIANHANLHFFQETQTVFSIYVNLI